ncbi:MAG: hypothetical protein HC835_13040 [Oscillatoriales cyanobacterium RM2_1_1]|nr:hypothetical protein [Oscillatoriales cyanobacterium SM2_3_0]NJO46474.1 hypothetical protein [Oscillatoriales cyanobacterium RM2_1_1]
MPKSNPTSLQINGYLLVLVPATAFLLLCKTPLPLLLTLLGSVGAWRFWNKQQQQHQDKLADLDQMFYQLLQEHQGRVTPLDLALRTRLSGTDVQQYLDQKAVEFSAQFEVTEQGNVIYCFQTVQPLKPTPPKIKIPNFSSATSEQYVPEPSFKEIALFPLSLSTSLPAAQVPLRLNQSDLAKRLQVHPNTLSRWKTRPQFPQWSALKDPEAIAWTYSLEARCFSPLLKPHERTGWKKWFGIDSEA